MDKIELVVSDLAGTIVDFGSQAPVAAFMACFAKWGVPITVTEARAPMGMHKRDHIRAILHASGVKERWNRVYQRRPDEEDVQRLFADFVPLQLEVLPRHLDGIPGAVRFSEFLRQSGICLAVTTGYNSRMLAMVMAALKREGIEPQFGISAEEVPAGRPAPHLIHACMKACGITDSKRVVKIGDTLADIAAGRNAGCLTVGVTDTGNLFGLTEQELLALDTGSLLRMREAATEKFNKAGADVVIPGISHFSEVMDTIF